jgi:alpha-galactosidase
LPTTGEQVTVRRVSSSVKNFPSQRECSAAQPVRFCHDWQGRNEDPLRETEVRLLWNEAWLFIRFACRYRTQTVFEDAEPSGRRHELWDRDVAEVFLQPDRFGEKYYKEFEVSPNGLWLDLGITPAGLSHIASGMRLRVHDDCDAKVWTADVAIPFVSITSAFDPAQLWRVNFFRCEGSEPQRFYSGWQPTKTETPNFHVPQKFGWLRFGT